MTYLPAAVIGMWFHLYLILDLYSRKIVGWEVHATDDSVHAAHLVRRTALAEGIATMLTKPVLHGDNGEDNTKPLVMSVDDIEDPRNWVQTGPHLMMMPKDPTSLDSFPTDFSAGAPFVMFKGSKFAHVMIPLNPSGTSGWTEASIPHGLAHNEAAWKIAAFSSAAPAKIGDHATVMDTDGATVLRAGTNGWTCMSANMHPEPAEGWPTAHNAEPLCLDAVGFQWIAGYMAGTPPVMDRDTFVFMLHGDNGYDNSNPAVRTQADSAPGQWIESGPHLMLMPKDPATLDAFTDDFHRLFVCAIRVRLRLTSRLGVGVRASVA